MSNPTEARSKRGDHEWAWIRHPHHHHKIVAGCYNCRKVTLLRFRRCISPDPASALKQ